MKPGKDSCFCFQMGLVFASAPSGIASANYFAHRFASKCFRGAGFNQNRFRTLGPVRKNNPKSNSVKLGERGITVRINRQIVFCQEQPIPETEFQGLGLGWKWQVLLPRASECFRIRFRKRWVLEGSLSIVKPET